MEAGLCHNIDLDGGVTTRVIDVASVDLGDGHRESFSIERLSADARLEQRSDERWKLFVSQSEGLRWEVI